MPHITHKTHKSPKIDAMLVEIEASLPPGEPHPFNRHYIGYFHCFNRQLYYEAHDVLEEVWLPLRGTEVAKFYQGLIQMAGAFVHFQKKRLAPGGRLLQLALKNYALYPDFHEGVNLETLRAFCRERYQVLVDHQEQLNPWSPAEPPQLRLPEVLKTTL